MRYLLDTHVLIWFLNGDKALPEKIKRLIEDENNSCCVSIASLWEMAIKISLKKLSLTTGFDEIINVINQFNIEIIPIDLVSLYRLSELKFHHNDPFDRTLITQAKVEKLVIITKDREFKKYGVKLLWD